MTSLVLASAWFLGIHLLISGTRLRDPLARLVGEKGFRALFSLAAIGGLVWMSWAYAHAPYVQTWGVASSLKPALWVTNGLAFLLLVMGAMTPNPTLLWNMAGPEADKEFVQGMARITRHPGMWGIAIWALGHLAVNGDVASHLFFGSLAFLAMTGTASMDNKYRRRFGESWEAYCRQTSNVPFVAILTGRNRLVWREFKPLGVVVSVLVYAAFLFGHQWLFGVSPF